MSEKGELPPDQMSLPPNYAPSEAYTESPPPAYPNKKSTVVAVTRMICLTILAGAFMIGFFSLSHSWLKARDSNGKHDDRDGIKSGSFIEFPPTPQVQALVGHKEEEKSMNTIITDINNNEPQLNDSFNEDDQKSTENSEIQSDDILPKMDEEISSLQQKVNILDQVETEIEDEKHILEDSVQQEFDDVKNNIKIPLDAILGNPSLAGRDVNCKVERRQKDIGGLITQAIIVKCNDKVDAPSIPSGMSLLSSSSSQRPLGPQLSLFAPIMKMLAAKAKKRAENFNSMNNKTPQILNGPKPIIMSSTISGPMGGPIRMIRGPMPGPISGPRPFPINAPRFPSIRGPIMPGPRRPISNINSSPMANFNENIKIFDEVQQPKMIPMSISPMRIANGRSIRVLPFGKEPRVDSFQNLPNDLPSFQKFPSAFPIKNVHELRNFPGPQPRGLNSPIALPELRHLPARLLNAYPQPTSSVRLAEKAELPKPITHMEMRQPEHKSEPIVTPSFKPEGPEFGPPKIHTVIGPPKNMPQLRIIPHSKTLHELPPMPSHFFNPSSPTFPPAPLHPEFTSPPAPAPAPYRPEPSPPAPPHPKINPEGLTGIVSDINPDAEVVEPMADHASTAPTPLKHHLILN